MLTFLAIMELVRERILDFVQAEAFAPIHVRAGERHDVAEEMGLQGREVHDGDQSSGEEG